MAGYTAHTDTFARDHLPPPEQFPDLIFELPEVQYPERLNAAVELLDRAVERGWGDRPALYGHDATLTYAQLLAQSNQVARLLLEDIGLPTGARVLLRGPNNPMLAVCWFGVLKAGMIAVTTMPLLRQRELSEIIDKAQVTFALCDKRFDEELIAAQEKTPILREIVYYNYPIEDDERQAALASLEARMAGKGSVFAGIDTASDDVAIIAFTSGTTGKPKGTMHFHRDLLAICDTFPRSIVGIGMDDICIGTPPLAFTYGLGGILLFPLRVGGASVLVEKFTPESMIHAVHDFHATITWTSPFFYRQMAALIAQAKAVPMPTLRKCISAGEALPISTRTAWREATGIEIIDGIGATEMLHIFISHTESQARPGATGKPVPGYRACVIDEAGNPLPPGQIGRLAVKGPTGCRYLADNRQRSYVLNGWNVTGDAYLVDQDGYFHYQARTDDMIITTGYNVAGPEVEDALLLHPAVAECAVIGAPDEERGTIIKAFVVLRPGCVGDEAMIKMLQDHVKETIAPYKYPRAIVFMDSLPRTETGKLQRFKLRQMEMAHS